MKNEMTLILVTLLLAGGLAKAEALALPKEYAASTNLNRLSWPAQMKFRNDITAAAQKGDMARFGAMVKLLEKTPIANPSFEMWMAGVNGLLRAGDEQQRKKPADRNKELMAGFREGGSTFGLWQGAEKLETNPSAAFSDAAVNLLLKKMPHEGLTPALRVRLAREVLRIRTKNGSYETCLPAADAVRTLAFAVKPVTKEETNAVCEAGMSYGDFLANNQKYLPFAAFAREFRMMRADVLGASKAAYWLGLELGAYDLACDEKSFLALEPSFRKLAPGDAAKSGIEGFRRMAIRTWPNRWAKVREIAEPTFATRKRHFKGADLAAIDHLRFEVAAGLRDYAAAKDAYDELCAVEAVLKQRWDDENRREKDARAAEKIARQKKAKFTPFVRDQRVERPTNWTWNDRARFVDLALEAKDWASAAAALEKGLERRNAQNHVKLLKALAHLGNVQRVREVAAELHTTNVQAKAGEIFTGDALVAWLEAKDPASLRKNLEKVRGDRDDKAWFEALRAASRLYIGLDSTPARTAWLKEVIAMSNELLWPAEQVVYELTWLENAPRSAEGAWLKNIFKTLKIENRMATYNVYSPFEKEKDLARVKSNPKPDLATKEPGKEAVVCAAYDESGLHVYARFSDPEAFKAREGLTGGFNCEYDFQPGGEAPWHWNMVTRADEANVDQGAVWDSPRAGFKVGAEYIREDTYVADDCYVFHLFIPWILCYREFPKDGDVWRLVLVAGWAGQFGSLGGGAVHELGRGLQLKFALSEKVRPKMIKALLREAVRDYHKVRDPWENAAFWADPDLGDPAFSETVVEPFLKSCDELAKECADPALSDARAQEIFSTRLKDLADFRLVLDQKRADYLKAKLFSK